MGFSTGWKLSGCKSASCWSTPEGEQQSLVLGDLRFVVGGLARVALTSSRNCPINILENCGVVVHCIPCWVFSIPLHLQVWYVSSQHCAKLHFCHTCSMVLLGWSVNQMELWHIQELLLRGTMVRVFVLLLTCNCKWKSLLWNDYAPV